MSPTASLSKTKQGKLPSERQNDYKVKDIKLAEWGRKEITIAQSQMPGLTAIRE